MACAVAKLSIMAVLGPWSGGSGWHVVQSPKILDSCCGLDLECAPKPPCSEEGLLGTGWIRRALTSSAMDCGVICMDHWEVALSWRRWSLGRALDVSLVPSILSLLPGCPEPAASLPDDFSAMARTNQGPRPLKPQDRVNISSSKWPLLGVVATEMKSGQTQEWSYSCLSTHMLKGWKP